MAQHIIIYVIYQSYNLGEHTDRFFSRLLRVAIFLSLSLLLILLSPFFTRAASCEIVVPTRARERGCYHLGYKHLIFRGVDSYPSGETGAPPRARLLSHPVICATWRALRAAREPRVVIPHPGP